MAKKYTYTFKEIAEDVIKKLPGHYKNFDSANATVRATARELGINDINGKGKYKIVPAVQAEIILKAVIERATRRPYTPSTPIEQEIRRAEKAESDVFQIPSESPIKNEPVIKINVSEIDAREIAEKLKESMQYGQAEIMEAFKPEPRLTATEKKAIADDFELRRKRFYTDVRFFLKFAQTPDERTEIWRALSALYGISAQARPQTIPTETEEQRDKWSI